MRDDPAPAPIVPDPPGHSNPGPEQAAMNGTTKEVPPGFSRNLPSPEGEALGRELARLIGPEIARVRREHPDLPGPCNTCAFKLGSIPNRCLSTVADALKCVMEHEPFMCHERYEGCDPDGKGGDPEGERLVCMGWMAAVSAGEPDRKPVEMPWPYMSGE